MLISVKLYDVPLKKGTKWLDGNERQSQTGIFHYSELCMKGWSAFPLKLAVFRG